MMLDLTDPRWMKVKGILFLLTGLAASGLLLMECPSLKGVVLLGIASWCF